MQVYNNEIKEQKMKNIHKGNKMKTTKMMLLGVVATVALGTGAFATCATNVDMGNHKITNVADPVNTKDVVNKRYLEAYIYETMKNRFIRDNSNEIVLDVSTNLMWQDNAAASTVKKRWLTKANYNAGNYYNTSGDTAATYCTNLSLGGFSNWRLPAREELLGIVKSNATSPTISSVFQHVVSNNYWSSTTYAGDTGMAWGVAFSGAYQSHYIKRVRCYVRCVRAGQ